jgi:hypothetical protein
MIGFPRIRSFLVCSAALALSAGWNGFVRPELAAQTSTSDNVLDPAW